MTEGVPESMEQRGVLVEAGVTSFKLYMAYRRRGIMVDEAALFSVMRHASKLGALVAVRQVWRFRLQASESLLPRNWR